MIIWGALPGVPSISLGEWVPVGQGDHSYSCPQYDLRKTVVYKQTLPPGVKQRKLQIIRPSCFHLGRIWRYQEASRRCASESRSVTSDFLRPHGLLPGSSVQGILQARIQEWVVMPFSSGLLCPPPGDLPNPGIEPRSSTLLAESLPSEPAVKPKNTGVGSLSLLQGIFLT